MTAPSAPSSAGPAIRPCPSRPAALPRTGRPGPARPATPDACPPPTARPRPADTPAAGYAPAPRPGQPPRTAPRSGAARSPATPARDASRRQHGQRVDAALAHPTAFSARFRAGRRPYRRAQNHVSTSIMSRTRSSVTSLPSATTRRRPWGGPGQLGIHPSQPVAVLHHDHAGRRIGQQPPRPGPGAVHPGPDLGLHPDHGRPACAAHTGRRATWRSRPAFWSWQDTRAYRPAPPCGDGRRPYRGTPGSAGRPSAPERAAYPPGTSGTRSSRGCPARAPTPSGSHYKPTI